MAVSDRFQRAFQRLSGAFGAHHDAPRDPERVVELARARAALEDRRADMKVAREREDLTPFRRENPDWVDPKVGMGATGWGAKLLAVLGAVVMFGGLVVVVNEFRQWGVIDENLAAVDFEVESEPVTDGGCVVTVTGVLRNDSSGPIRIVGANFDAVENANGTSLDTWPAELDRTYLEPGMTAVVSASFPVPVTLVDPARCPAVPGGELRVTYSEATGPIQVVSVEL